MDKTWHDHRWSKYTITVILVYAKYTVTDGVILARAKCIGIVSRLLK